MFMKRPIKNDIIGGVKLETTNINAVDTVANKLNYYRNTVVKLIGMEEEVKFWKNRLEHIKILALPPQSAKNINKIINNLISHIELELRECICLRAECIYIIEEIDDPTIKQILYLRYISGLSYEKIAEKMNYCIRHITRLHQKGLELLTQKEVMSL